MKDEEFKQNMIKGMESINSNLCYGLLIVSGCLMVIAIVIGTK